MKPQKRRRSLTETIVVGVDGSEGSVKALQ